MVDGLKGFPEAITTVFPDCVVQTCIVHLMRKIVYTTNAIESLHSQVRKAICNKGPSPSDEAATKLMYLALRKITAKC